MLLEERLPITFKFGCKAKTDLSHMRRGSNEVHLPVGNEASTFDSSQGFSSLSMFNIPSLSASNPDSQTYWPVLLSLSIRELAAAFVVASAALSLILDATSEI